MEPKVYFVVNVDTDPDPSDTPRNDESVIEKYGIMQDILREYANAKSIACVHTSPMYRERFFENKFMDIWKNWVQEGGELILHPEEDLYGTPETKQAGTSLYLKNEHMESVIVKSTEIMKKAGLPLGIYKGGYQTITHGIVQILKKVEIGIDVTCAPNIVWPIKNAYWENAPVSAYYMSEDSETIPSDPVDKNQIFEIPFGWDGIDSETTHNHLLNEHYLVNEFSTHEAMCKVWDVIVERAAQTGNDQYVGMLCHTYSMMEKKYPERLKKTLAYMCDHNGTPSTASEIKRLYDSGL